MKQTKKEKNYDFGTGVLFGYLSLAFLNIIWSLPNLNWKNIIVIIVMFFLLAFLWYGNKLNKNEIKDKEVRLKKKKEEPRWGNIRYNLSYIIVGILFGIAITEENLLLIIFTLIVMIFLMANDENNQQRQEKK